MELLASIIVGGIIGLLLLMFAAGIGCAAFGIITLVWDAMFG